VSDAQDKNSPGEPNGDELIMAYADGVLPAHLRRAARDELAGNPDLMASLDSYIFTGVTLPNALDEMLVAAPVPERTLQMLREPVASQTRRAPSLFGSASLARLVDKFRLPTFSLAVALPSVVVAVAAGWLAHTTFRSSYVPLDDRGFVAWAALQQALEQTPGGESVKLADGIVLKPTATFASAENTWCREFELTYTATVQSGALACRNARGDWRVIHQTEPASPRPSTDPTKFKPAEGSALLEETKAKIRKAGSSALGPSLEERLIKDRWSTKTTP
jgi:hypothetical protein